MASQAGCLRLVSVEGIAEPQGPMSVEQLCKYIGILGSNSGRAHGDVLVGVRRYAKAHGLTTVDFSEAGQLAQEAALAWPVLGCLSFRSDIAVSVPTVSVLSEGQVKAAVDIDRSAIAREAFSHLRSLNPHSINFLRGPDCSTELTDSWKVVSEAYGGKLGEFALKCDSPSLGGLTPGEKTRFEQWLFDLPRPAAICCTTDILALATLTTCRRLGLSAPEDVAVVTCDNSRLAEQFQTGISGVSGALENVGYEAASVLVQVASGSEPSMARKIVPGAKLEARGTTDRLAALPEDVRIAQEFIQREACRGINVKDVMGTQNVSRVTFERRFKEFTGKTPGAEIRRIRVEKAEELLKTTNIPVSEVASRCGFEGSSRFSLFFRKRCGLSPSEYRSRFSS